MHSFLGKHGFHYKLSELKLHFLNQDLSLAILADPDLIIDEMFAHLEKIGAPDLLLDYCPYFGCLWPAARALAQVLSEKKLKGLKLLERKFAAFLLLRGGGQGKQA